MKPSIMIKTNQWRKEVVSANFPNILTNRKRSKSRINLQLDYEGAYSDFEMPYFLKSRKDQPPIKSWTVVPRMSPTAEGKIPIGAGEFERWRVELGKVWEFGGRKTKWNVEIWLKCVSGRRGEKRAHKILKFELAV